MLLLMPELVAVPLHQSDFASAAAAIVSSKSKVALA